MGWVVVRLVSVLRSEHDALIQANRQLAQRAATIGQLTESRERNRLARELHDTLAHSLTGVSVQLQALGTLMEHDQPEAAKAQLKETQTTVRERYQGITARYRGAAGVAFGRPGSCRKPCASYVTNNLSTPASILIAQLKMSRRWIR